MTYFDPKVYNYSNLREEDKLFIQHSFTIIDRIDDMKADYDIDENTSIIERILYETGKETISEVLTHLYYFLIDYVGTKIDGYDEDIHEIDTDDYFYGMD